MPKHRSTVYTVVREKSYIPHDENRRFANVEDLIKDLEREYWEFSAIIGTYATINRAEEVMGACAQGMRDEGFTDEEFRFSVKASTWYDE
jgi:hypothetical protein